MQQPQYGAPQPGVQMMQMQPGMQQPGMMIQQPGMPMQQMVSGIVGGWRGHGGMVQLCNCARTSTEHNSSQIAVERSWHMADNMVCPGPDHNGLMESPAPCLLISRHPKVNVPQIKSHHLAPLVANSSPATRHGAAHDDAAHDDAATRHANAAARAADDDGTPAAAAGTGTVWEQHGTHD